ncbi:MAG TPA: RsmE family RNA methyltransferase [Pontiellaceae bacterium]|nr:RsmE family RNA methyltransferase [Pontiellaceae bacterium]
MNLILIHPHEPDREGRVRLCGERAEHICTVLRAGSGKALRIGLLNGPLGSGTVEEIRGKEVVLRCEFEGQIPARPAVDLLLAMPRPKVMKRLWAQLAALGVGRIILVNAEKVERFYFDSHVLEPDFYAARLAEGLQQAGDTIVPEVRIVKELKPFLEDELGRIFPADGIRLLADPSGAQNIFQCLEKSNIPAPRGDVPQRSCLAVGPEGGWTPYELEMFTAHGFEVFNAGTRILRTDTACVALLSMLTLLSGADEK